MHDRSERSKRLLVGVETAYGSGVFHVDQRLLVEEVEQRCDLSVSTARIVVRLSDAFDSEEARRYFHPDRRLLIITDEPEEDERQILFEGYPPVQQSSWDGRIGKEDESYVLEAEHVFTRLTKAPEAAVYGCHVRNGRIEDGLVESPELYQGESARITALPCVFNPDGEGNEAAVPLTVADDAGQTHKVPLFTYPGDTLGRKWTYASVLRYLIWFHLPKHGPVAAGNVYDVTRGIVETQAGDVTAVANMLRAEPVSLVCEATSLAEALGAWSEASGLHVVVETVRIEGRPVSQIRIWATGDGVQRKLYLQRGGCYEDGVARYDAWSRSASQVLAENNTYRGEVAWDHRGIVNHPIVIGGVKQYEMTVPLVPGWLPAVDLDSVAIGDREDAKALALTPDQTEAWGGRSAISTWFRKYHRQGSLFDEHPNTSRLWVLNEDGAFDSDLYNRNAPFHSYAPFDFSTVFDASETSADGWMRRPRRFLPTISRTAEGGTVGVWIEVSFDSGSNWQQQSSGVRVIDDRCGIYFDCDNPTEIAPTGTDPAEDNMWYAIIDQRFRVRVTAVIASDDRLIGTVQPHALYSPTKQVNAFVVRNPKGFQLISRDHATTVLPSTSDSAGRDDTAAIQVMAERLGQMNQDRRVSVSPAIPWLETSYQIGDRVTEIRGRHVQFATRLGVEDCWPAVLGRRFVLRDGRYETELTLGVTSLKGSVS